MASVKELLENSLNELVTKELKKFQWYLKDHKGIPKSEMENADVFRHSGQDGGAFWTRRSCEDHGGNPEEDEQEPSG